MAGTDILINELTHDIDLSNETMRLTSTLEELARQKVSITLQAYKGEWSFNVLFGIPYLKNASNPIQLLGSGNNKRLLDFEIRKAILDKEEILSITSFESSIGQVSREYSVSFEAQTEQGPIVFEGVLNI